MKSDLVDQAAEQHGLLCRSQFADARQLGTLRRRLRTGEWVVEQPGVVRPATTVPDFAMRIAAVALSLNCDGDTEWVFSHRTAAHLHGLPLPEPDEVDVLLAAANREAPLSAVRRHLTREPPRRAWREGYPVSPVPQTVVQCGRGVSREELVHVVEYAVRERLTTLPRLREVCGRGVDGSAALRDVLDELSAEGIDKWMRRLVRALRSTNLPTPELEVPMLDAGGRVHLILDGLFRDVGLGLEMDDWETHGSRAAQERDRERDRWLLREHGVTVLRVTPRQLRRGEADVVQDIESGYRQLAARRVDVAPDA